MASDCASPALKGWQGTGKARPPNLPAPLPQAPACPSPPLCHPGPAQRGAAARPPRQAGRERLTGPRRFPAIPPPPGWGSPRGKPASPQEKGERARPSPRGAQDRASCQWLESGGSQVRLRLPPPHARPKGASASVARRRRRSARAPPPLVLLPTVASLFSLPPPRKNRTATRAVDWTDRGKRHRASPLTSHSTGKLKERHGNAHAQTPPSRGTPPANRPAGSGGASAPARGAYPALKK